jgi:ABC-type polysaccharide/polyol phosphate transport system ATPase subunit
MSAIELKDVWKKYSLEREKVTTLKEKFVNIGKKKEKEEIVALKEINLAIEKGECFGILGKNGSGKTTLLKIIAGILKPNKGEVKIEGKVVPILTLGLGFQRELTARENVYLYASVLGMKKREIDENYERIVKFSELENVMDVKLKDFSDGMVMRLSFSIAFHVNVDIILIDEVLAVGDAAFQTKCLEKIKELKEEGKTIVMVSHSAEDIKRFCDRALILDKGEIIFFGEAQKVCEKYEEIIESERLKRWNEEAEKENKIEFDAFFEYPYVLKKGERCEMNIKIENFTELPNLFFERRDRVRVFSKKLEDEKLVFRTDSLPLSEGEYNVWIEQNNEFLTKKPFKVLVKNSKESEENKVYMLPSSRAPFQDLTLVFGEVPEKEAKEFEKGKAVFVFENLESATNGENACLFKENRVLALDKKEVVLEKFKDEIYQDLAVKHFKDILIKTELGRSLIGYERNC